MRLIKMFGLAALAAAVATACVGASASASTSTQLCQVHTGLTCPAGKGTSFIHMALVEGTVGKLLAAIPVLCLGVLVEATALGLAKPQVVHVTSQTFGCGTGSGHDNCTVTVEEQPLTNLLKTGLDEGVLTVPNGRTRLVCANIGINCVYDLEGTEFAIGAQHLSADEVPTTELGGGFFCPFAGEEKGSLDGLLESLGTSYKETPETSLCKTHSKHCEAKDQVTGLHLVTAKPPVLYNTIANIECESSLGTATAKRPGEPQELQVTKLTWEECHTQGAADNCTVTSEALPTIDLERTALNLGTVTTLGLEIGVECLILGLIELDCVYGNEATLEVEGALHKEETGHGMFTASKVELPKLEGSGHCPESVKWDALYEPLEHLYVTESFAASGGAYILQ